MKQSLTMLVGCALPLLLIFLLPAIGLGSGWIFPLAIGTMLVCHLLHFGGHDHAQNGKHNHEHHS